MSNLNVNNLTPLAGTSGTISVSGSLIVSGTITANGNITLGDSVNDSVSFGAEISSSLIPDADDTYDLGSSAKQWNDLYIDNIAYIDRIEGVSIPSITGSVIISGSLTIHGTGSLKPSDDGVYDLGTADKEWKDLYVDGIGYIDYVSASSAAFVTIYGDVHGDGQGQYLSIDSPSVRFSGDITASGTVSASSFAIQIGYANSLDFASSTEYSVHGNKVEVKATTDGTIADGAFIEFKLKNTSIASDSIVLGSFTGGTVGLITGSILTAATIAASTASVQIHNETGGTIADDTPFTASFVVF